MAKRTSKSKKASKPVRRVKQAGPKAAASKRREPKDAALPETVPSMLFVEQVMSDMFGHSSDPTFNAQQVAYDAMEAFEQGNMDVAFGLAMKAAEMDPNCVDALSLIAEIDCPDDQALLEETQEIVARGEKALGKRFFKENAGYFWGLIETRPYMRARASLADLLVKAGRREEAVQHYEEMLRLNPGDNQGLRYVLLGHYLVLGRLDGARRLLDQYPNEGSAFFAWARVLDRLMANDLDGAAGALKAARECNQHVEKYLTQRKKLPKNSPGYYSPGQDSEAVVCMIEIGEAWQGQPAAIEWLKQQKPVRTKK